MEAEWGHGKSWNLVVAHGIFFVIAICFLPVEFIYTSVGSAHNSYHILIILSTHFYRTFHTNDIHSKLSDVAVKYCDKLGKTVTKSHEICIF